MYKNRYNSLARARAKLGKFALEEIKAYGLIALLDLEAQDLVMLDTHKDITPTEIFRCTMKKHPRATEQFRRKGKAAYKMNCILECLADEPEMEDFL